MTSGGSSAFEIIPAELRKQIATDGDLATVLIAGPIGFVGDIGLSLTGLVSPGTCAVLTASTALGLKRWFQAAKRSLSRPDEDISMAGAPDKKSGRELREKTERLLRRSWDDWHNNTSEEGEPPAELATLRAEMELFDDGLSDVSDLKSAFDKALIYYRSTKGLAQGDKPTTNKLRTPRAINVY